MSQTIRKKKIKLFRPHTGQWEIIYGLKGPQLYHLVSCGRQFGKSLLARQLAIMWAFSQKNSIIGYLTPTHLLGKTMYKDLKRSCPKSEIEWNDTDKLIRFKGTGSTIQFFSVEKYENIRGQHFTHLICDEFAYYRPDAWVVAIKPTVIVHGRKILFISTPKGKNHFWNLWVTALNNPKRYRTYQMPTSTNPKITDEELEATRLETPEEVWLQEYMAQFLDGTGAVFKGFFDCMTGTERMPRPGEKIYYGIDIGHKNDFTVLTILNQQRELLLQRKWRGHTFDKKLEAITDILAPSGPNAVGYVETNGIGAMPHEELEKRLRKSGVKVKAFTTTNDSKTDQVDLLRLWFQRRETTLPAPNPKSGKSGEETCIYSSLKLEMESFSASLSRSGMRITYSAPTGLHDDQVMSLMIAAQAWEDFGKTSGGRKFARIS